MAEETNKSGRPIADADLTRMERIVKIDGRVIDVPVPGPAPAIEAGEATLIEGGMTNREVAALSIMAAIISNPGTRIVNFHVLDSGVIAPFLAKEAIALADALIAELDKGKDTENEMA